MRTLLILLAIGRTLFGRPDAASAQESGGTILVLGVTAGQHQEERLTNSLERYLGRTEQVVSSRSLRAEERRCNEPRCLYALAQRKGAKMLIGASTTPINESDSELAVYLLLCADKTWRHVEATVAKEQLAEQLNELVRKLMRGPEGAPRHPALLPGRPNSRLIVTDELMKVLNAHRAPLNISISPEIKKRLGIPFLTIGSLALGTSVLLSALGSQYNTPERCFGGFVDTCVDRGRPIALAGYLAGGGLALAGTLILAIPSRKSGGR